MNKFLKINIFLYIICCLFCSTLPPLQASADSQTYFARIVSDGIMLYSAPAETSALFCLPKTYFVELFSETDNNFYYAKYDDIYGYVKKDEVQPVQQTPSSPYLQNISFRIFVPSGANLRSTPYNLGTANLVYSIPFLETNLKYYGTIMGEEAISKKGTTWYYCKYFVNNLSYSGYVYQPLCDELPIITENTETVLPLDVPPVFENTSSIQNPLSPGGLSQTAQVIIVVVASLPCLLFIYLLFRPTRIAESENAKNKTKSNKTTKNSGKIRKLKHSDYFEIDDDF